MRTKKVWHPRSHDAQCSVPIMMTYYVLVTVFLPSGFGATREFVFNWLDWEFVFTCPAFCCYIVESIYWLFNMLLLLFLVLVLLLLVFCFVLFFPGMLLLVVLVLAAVVMHVVVALFYLYSSFSHNYYCCYLFSFFSWFTRGAVRRTHKSRCPLLRFHRCQRFSLRQLATAAWNIALHASHTAEYHACSLPPSPISSSVQVHSTSFFPLFFNNERNRFFSAFDFMICA